MQYQRKIRLEDTDATGVLFFPRQLTFSLEVLENFLEKRGLPLEQLFRENMVMPVVHASSNYYKPLFVGDMMTIHLMRGKKGEKSLTLHYRIYKGQELVGDCKIIHATVDALSKESIEVPKKLRELFDGLPMFEDLDNGA